jgi:hypothetical protein
MRRPRSTTLPATRRDTACRARLPAITRFEPQSAAHLVERARHCCAPGAARATRLAQFWFVFAFECVPARSNAKVPIDKELQMCYLLFRGERKQVVCLSPPRSPWKSPRVQAVTPPRFTSSRKPFVFRRSHTLFLGIYNSLIPNGLRTLAKTGGYTPFRPKTELDSWCQAGVWPSLPSLGLSQHPNVPILGEVCLRSHFRFGFNQEGLS